MTRERRLEFAISMQGQSDRGISKQPKHEIVEQNPSTGDIK